MIIKWHEVRPGLTELYTEADEQMGVQFPQNVIRGVWLPSGSSGAIAYLVRRPGDRWVLKKERKAVFDCATDDLDLAVAKINLLFVSR